MSINKNMQCSGKEKKKKQDSYSIAYLKLRNLLEKNLSLFIVPLMKI